MSDSVQPHRRRPTRLPRPWDSLGKNTGVGCHFLLQGMKGKSESEVTQSCPTLRDPMVFSLPGSSVHGIFQARVLEWGAIAFSNCKLTILQLKKKTLFIQTGSVCQLLGYKIPTHHLVLDILTVPCRHQAISQSLCKELDMTERLNWTESIFGLWKFNCSVAKSCPTLWDPMDYSPPGFPVLHYLPEFAQTHIH